MIGAFIGTIIGFIIGGMFGFLICAILVSSEEDKEGKR